MLVLDLTAGKLESVVESVLVVHCKIQSGGSSMGHPKCELTVSVMHVLIAIGIGYCREYDDLRIDHSSRLDE